MEINFKDFDFKAVGNEPVYPSWESVLRPEERLGGPSAHGNSWWSTFSQCPRKFYLSHVKRLRPAGISNALEIGGLMHEAVARFYTQGATEAWEIVNRVAEVSPVVAMEVRRLLTAWLMHYGPEGLRPKPPVRAVELLLEVEEPFPYSCRIDAVCSHEGKLYIHEMKTASRLDQNLLSGYELNSQFLGQKYLWRHAGQEKQWGKLAGFVVDLIVKTKQVQLEEINVEIPDKHVHAWAKNMRQLWGEMCHAVNYDIWPQRLSNCTLYASRCSFFKYCASLGRDTEGLVKKARGEW